MMRQCPDCHGSGGYVDVILEDGSGPRETCGICNGDGELDDDELYFRVLGWASAEKRRRKNGKL